MAEELDETGEALRGGSKDAIGEELGDLLFAVVNLARLAGAHPLTVLAHANEKFQDRFERLEKLAEARGIAMEDAGLEALDALWDEVKRG